MSRLIPLLPGAKVIKLARTQVVGLTIENEEE
jgi:hypothetical protein